MRCNASPLKRIVTRDVNSRIGLATRFTEKTAWYESRCYGCIIVDCGLRIADFGEDSWIAC